MFAEFIRRITIGIAAGGFLTFIALTILMINNIESTVSEIWLHMLGSMSFGVYYGFASFIFEKPRWTPLMKTVVHLSLSIIVYYIIALSVGWLPFTFFAIAISFIIFLSIYFIFWTGYYIYYKRLEADLNEHLQKKE
ncbi:DUF3021 domain-containing protein [Ornithinibacillus californiensis]|uniref:DUF3021 domain-containing protein n=1 Tax=Ornithinibacillus californiensis TaxID=161536 RepID=UPI00064D762E|nr:DUF3021 domain-containing protein [Ornithinibacillus californiensis]